MNFIFQVDVLAQWTPQVNSMFWLFKRIVRGDRGREAHVRQIKLTAPFSFPEIRPTSTWPALPRASPKTKMKQEERKHQYCTSLHFQRYTSLILLPILYCTRICLNIYWLAHCTLQPLHLKKYLIFLEFVWTYWLAYCQLCSWRDIWLS